VPAKPVFNPPKNEPSPAEKTENEALQAQKKAIEAEQRLQARREVIVKLAGLTIVQDLLTTLVTNTVNDILPDSDPLLLPLILSDIVQVSDSSGTGKLSALVTMRTLSELNDNPDGTTCPLQ
jgi:hypothetical protein